MIDRREKQEKRSIASFAYRGQFLTDARAMFNTIYCTVGNAVDSFGDQLYFRPVQ